MAGIYGHTWSSRMPTPEAVKVALSDWEQEIRKVTSEQIKNALAKCRDSHGKHVDFPPTLPQFIRLCLPEAEEIGIPTAEEAYYQAISPNVEKHPLVVKSIAYIDAYTFRRLPESEARNRFMPVYNQLKDRFFKEQVQGYASNALLEGQGVAKLTRSY